MPEDAGKLEVKYSIISDAALRQLERLQKQFDKVGDAAEKQGKKVQAAYKKSAKSMAVYGAAAMGMLYGLIKASSYAAMWMDQLGHSMTRIANVIMDKLGLKDAIDFLIGALSLLADELEKPKETAFWQGLLDKFIALDTKSKIATVAIIVLIAAIGLLAAEFLVVKIAGFLSMLASGGVAARIFAAGTALATLATKGLSIALGILTSPITLIILAVLALAAILTYLWLKTEYGKAQIKALGIIWDNFKQNIKDVGVFKAVIEAIKEIFTRICPIFFAALRDLIIYLNDLGGKIREALFEMGKKGIKKLAEGIGKAYHWVADKWNYIKDNWKQILIDMATTGYNNAKEMLKKFVNGIINAYHWVESTYQALKNDWKQTLIDLATTAYTKGNELIKKFVLGILDKIPYLTSTFNYLTELWHTDTEVILDRATHTGEEIPKRLAEELEKGAENTEEAAEKVGGGIYDGILNSMSGTKENVCDEMVDAVDCVGAGVDGINDELDRIVTDIQIRANLEMRTGGYVASSAAGGSTGGVGGWAFSGWANSPSDSPAFDASATGGHVNQTGKVTVHQGEDIIHLKSLLSGTKGDNAKSIGDIIINPTINISSGNMSDPFEADRIANLISKRMGEELRRITTNI